MRTGKLFAAAIGTLILIVSFWFGFLTARQNPVSATALIAVGIVFAMYAVAGFSGADDKGTTGFKASLFAMIIGIGLIVAYQATDNASFVVVAPVVGAGVGGSIALMPAGDRGRTTARQAAVIVASVVLAYVFRVDEVVFALLTPLAPLLVLLLADLLYDRAREVADDAADSPGSERSA